MPTAQETPYNQRLFRPGWRARFHLARFEWVRRTLFGLRCPCDSVLELGCFDGRVLDHLPHSPRRYKGFDANWEGGLDAAVAARSAPGRKFLRAVTAADMRLDPAERFDVAISLETLEHVPPAEVEPYLRAIAAHLDGHLLVTVPNEIGPVFLFKWLVRNACLPGRRQRYSPSEILWSAAGRTQRIARKEHKGFDYRELLAQVGRHFEVVSVEGVPFGALPPWLCPGVGIVARSRVPRIV